MKVDYVIIQAGGKGTRMEYLTKNKPKALVPVNNLPIIFHAFKKFSGKEFIIIGDYKADVLKKYLDVFAEEKIRFVNANGAKGTCGGLQEALNFIPDNQPFILTWCDLILGDDYTLPESETNYIGISKDFPCRWSYINNQFIEEKSSMHGVAGHFIFKNKKLLKDVPYEGEFVRWLQEQNVRFSEIALYGTHEYGLLDVWQKLPKSLCRPFNKITFDGDRLIKEPINKQGEELSKRELAWYKKVSECNFVNLPKIYSYKPLIMEKINGKNIYEYNSIDRETKKKILMQVIACLKNIHKLEKRNSEYDSFYNAWIGKTFDRLNKIRNLVPFANDEIVIVNGKKCRNIFFHKKEVTKTINEWFPKEFHLIHGDCTFSNIMLKEDLTPILIDPRGYFGFTEYYGDVAYDWVKLYYSLKSNYDQFNLKRFRLHIRKNDVILKTLSNNWEDMEDIFFELLKGEITEKQIKLYLAITWLSLTTYAWEDYDSVCGAFYTGLEYLEDAL